MRLLKQRNNVIEKERRKENLLHFSKKKKPRRAFTGVSVKENEIVNQIFVPDWIRERHDAAYTE